MQDTIKSIVKNNRLIGIMETIRYVDIAVEHGHDAETIQILLRMFLEEKENEDA